MQAAAPVSREGHRPSHADARPEIASTRYANYCRVTGSPEELMIDFAALAQPLSAGDDVPAEQRIMMTPFTAKRLLGALSAAVRHYEQMFGPIEIDARSRVRSTTVRRAPVAPSVAPQGPHAATVSEAVEEAASGATVVSG